MADVVPVPEAETVTISKKEYDALVNDQRKLDALEACGVDNWQGWDEAMDMYHSQDNEDG
jgi:hypothetical protein